MNRNTMTSVLAAAMALMMTTTVAALAPAPMLGALVGTSATSDFESPSYATGTVHAQNGWSSRGAAGMGCYKYDHQIVANGVGAPAEFGAQSLRMSNAVGGGCFADHTFSASLANEAGEIDAANGGMSGGARQRVFEGAWSFTSAAPNVVQNGLAVVVSADRGDGARMSWVSMTDGPAGLGVGFYDYVAGPAAGCDGVFVYTDVATGLDRSAVHTVSMKMVLLEGAANDVVTVTVDGVSTHVGTSWEDYFRECQPDPTGGSRTVDSLLFRTGGAPAPATMGMGLLIDNVALASSVPTA